jgi:hypothetical protein
MIEVGDEVCLNEAGVEVPPGYDWSEDALQPGEFGEVVRTGNGIVVKGPRGNTDVYEEEFLEVVEAEFASTFDPDYEAPVIDLAEFGAGKNAENDDEEKRLAAEAAAKAEKDRIDAERKAEEARNAAEKKSEEEKLAAEATAKEEKLAVKAAAKAAAKIVADFDEGDRASRNSGDSVETDAAEEQPALNPEEQPALNPVAQFFVSGITSVSDAASSATQEAVERVAAIPAEIAAEANARIKNAVDEALAVPGRVQAKANEKIKSTVEEIQAIPGQIKVVVDAKIEEASQVPGRLWAETTGKIKALPGQVQVDVDEKVQGTVDGLQDDIKNKKAKADAIKLRMERNDRR